MMDQEMRLLRSVGMFMFALVGIMFYFADVTGVAGLTQSMLIALGLMLVLGAIGLYLMSYNLPRQQENPRRSWPERTKFVLRLLGYFLAIKATEWLLQFANVGDTEDRFPLAMALYFTVASVWYYTQPERVTARSSHS